jgi:choice-of-anchor C domain-containing protein
MSGTSAGTIDQTFATTAGVQYQVHFSLAGNPEDPTTEIHSLEVSAAGQTQDFSFNSTGHNRSNMGWLDETFTFTASGASTTLQFASLNHSAWGAALGNVSVSAAGTVVASPDTIAPDTTLTGTPAAQTTSNLATFTFTGTDNPGGSGVALFQASLDGANFSTAVSGISYSNLADGPHTFAVRAVDAAGNVDTTPATYAWTVASTSPPPSPPPPPSSGNLIQNGSFTPGTDASDVILVSSGSTAITGWTVTAGSVDDIRPTYWQSPDGGHTLDMSGLSAGTIAQTFATTVGVQYEVDFKLAGNPEDPTTEIHTLEVSAAGQSQDFTFNSTGYNRSNMGWQGETFTFTASDTSTTLQFSGLDHNAWGAALGDVSVHAHSDFLLI